MISALLPWEPNPRLRVSNGPDLFPLVQTLEASIASMFAHDPIETRLREAQAETRSIRFALLIFVKSAQKPRMLSSRQRQDACLRANIPLLDGAFLTGYFFRHSLVCT